MLFDGSFLSKSLRYANREDPAQTSSVASNLGLYCFNNVFGINGLAFKMASMLPVFAGRTPCATYFSILSSWHMTFMQRRFNVDVTLWRSIDVDTTLSRRHVHAGCWLGMLNIKTAFRFKVVTVCLPSGVFGHRRCYKSYFLTDLGLTVHNRILAPLLICKVGQKAAMYLAMHMFVRTSDAKTIHVIQSQMEGTSSTYFYMFASIKYILLYWPLSETCCCDSRYQVYITLVNSQSLHPGL